MVRALKDVKIFIDTNTFHPYLRDPNLSENRVPIFRESREE